MNIECFNNNFINEKLNENKEIFNELIIENNNRKEKSYISVNEFDLIKKFEDNLKNILEKTPPKIINELFKNEYNFK